MINKSIRYIVIIVSHLILIFDNFSVAQPLDYQKPIELVIKSVLVDYYKISDSCLIINFSNPTNDLDSNDMLNCWRTVTHPNDSCLKFWERNCNFNIIIDDSLRVQTKEFLIRSYWWIRIADTLEISQIEMDPHNDTALFINNMNEIEKNLSIKLLPLSYWKENVGKHYYHYCCRRSIVLHLTKPSYFFNGSHAFINCMICSGGSEACFRVSYHLENTINGWIICQSKVTAIW